MATNLSGCAKLIAAFMIFSMLLMIVFAALAAANTAPIAEDDAYATNESTPLNVSAPGVLGNDSDADGDPLTAVLDNDVSNGTLLLGADGSFTYTPAAGYSGLDSFSYYANDGLADSDTAATVTIDVINTPPTISGLPDQNLDANTSVDNAIDLWAYASDAESADADLTFSITGNTNPLCGVSIDIDTSRYIDINPATNWFGESDVTITVTDPAGASDTDTFRITVTPLAVDVDIKPGSCPNPFNGKSKGSVPVAIVGTADFDVTTVNPESITLAGVSALSEWVVKDSTEPADVNVDCFTCFDANEPENFNCDTDSDSVDDAYCGDGSPDLVVKFDTQELAAAIGAQNRGACVELSLVGNLFDGTLIVGSDSMVIKTKIKLAPSSASLTTCWGSLKAK